MDAFSLRECTHEDAIRILRQTSQNVRLKVLRDELPLREEDVYEVIQVELVKKVGKVSYVFLKTIVSITPRVAMHIGKKQMVYL